MDIDGLYVRMGIDVRILMDIDGYSLRQLGFVLGY